MEKNIITKISTLTEQIKETYRCWCVTTSNTIKERYCNKLKQQIKEYDNLIKQFDICTRCREILSDGKTEKYLGYSCHKNLFVFLYINVCVSCGKINIIKRERQGNCSGQCKPCTFKMEIEFPLNQTSKKNIGEE